MARTILLVEDDFDTQHPMAELLRLKGFQVITASSAEIAFHQAQEHQPDLIITDIVLPGKSGLQLIYNVRSDAVIHATPILVISGCEASILQDAQSVGANFCLPKPLHIDDFWEVLEKILISIEEPWFAWQSESAKAASASPAVVIDTLLDELDHCASDGERDDVLKRLKERILNLRPNNEGGLRV
ncbi:MAG: response regulator [Acidobacteria bacterium]|nr:response regulator [Acidobacteriota bacterium]